MTTQTKAFRAKHPSRCDRCDDRIYRDDLVRVTEDDLLIHANSEDCIDGHHTPVSGIKPEPLCSDCWTYHQGDC